MSDFAQNMFLIKLSRMQVPLEKLWVQPKISVRISICLLWFVCFITGSLQGI